VLASGEADPDDPQYGLLPPIDRLKNVEVVRQGQILKVGSLMVMARMTPGHTPGGTTWVWKSCEGARCLDIVYADSLTPVSAEGFKYSTSPLAKAFEVSYERLERMRCDILLTPHPAFAQLLEKLAAREMGKADAFIDPDACRAYAATGRKSLAARLERERKGK
jgi:metallo-beta-lactamase class B